MLKSLFIQNYALIDTLNIEFESGFSVITGETGAGKSIILGAINLLLGQRAESKFIKKNASKCTIEAVFDLSRYGMEAFFERNDLDFEGECIIRREISASGKSRTFINDTPVPLALLKELGETLIDIHSQHQNLLLNKEDFQMNVVDIMANNRQERETYTRLYKNFRSLSANLKKAIEQAEKTRAEEDYIRFQLEQLNAAQLQAGEQKELEKEAEMLEHAEDIKHALFSVDAKLNHEEEGAVTVLRECQHTLQNLQEMYASAEEMASRLQSCYIEVKDLAKEIAYEAEQIEYNPERLSYVNERLNTIYSLQQKHHVDTLEELIDLQEDYMRQLDNIENSEAHIQQLEREKDAALEEVKKQAAVLTEQRKQAAVLIESKMKELLIPLGIPNVRFCIDLQKKDEPDEKGMDKISFLFSANKNGELQQIAQVASGGEIARVMLSLKALISGAVKLPTIIFDEIDTGVSGYIAEKMAHIMQEMGASNRQVISITHLPQIAALGATHYKVYKEDNEQGTTSHIIRLNQEERVQEIAHMLSGSTLTSAAINNAKELLNMK